MALANNPTPYPFLWDDTNSTTGLAIAAVTVMTTELQSITTAGVKISSVNGASGVFLNTYFAQAIWADIYFSVGNPGLVGTLVPGANLCGWFLTTPDAGTTYESTTLVPPRAADFVIAMPPSTNLAALSFFAARNIILPALQFKILVQNNTGQTLSAGGTTAPYLKIAPYAVQY